MGGTRITDRDWRHVALPTVDETRCGGSGLCVAVCPTACLAMGPHVPWLPRPLDCVSCGLCAAVCPVDAIRLQPPDPDRPR